MVSCPFEPKRAVEMTTTQSPPSDRISLEAGLGFQHQAGAQRNSLCRVEVCKDPPKSKRIQKGSWVFDGDAI